LHSNTFSSHVSFDVKLLKVNTPSQVPTPKIGHLVCDPRVLVAAGPTDRGKALIPSQNQFKTGTRFGTQAFKTGFVREGIPIFKHIFRPFLCGTLNTFYFSI